MSQGPLHTELRPRRVDPGWVFWGCLVLPRQESGLGWELSHPNPTADSS